ncbi:PFU (PLAA family ubiquitin binding) [Carpediemonas membranifera]|uniref:PFU (PLAA family ubiquitin binding) n=1 Tax=Carpediemonas membranifera TaxID=201153 RepID=A0A8J6EBF7_9EUKA|nr:PFU (PLAA family ubiquitin binding) [Carpediemonas membranifera]|eukprot:KAG9397075.1 PFU (PLAA family ubiquitin binding) [Carpediemonas membranifera]
MNILTFSQLHNQAARGVVCIDERRILSVGYDGNIVLSTIDENATLTATKTANAHTNSIQCVAYSKGMIVTGGMDDVARIHSFPDLKQTAVLAGHTGHVSAVAIQPERQIIATGSWDHTVRLWTSSGDEICTIHGHTQPVLTVAFVTVAGDEYLVSGSADGTAIVWSMKSDPPARTHTFVFGEKIVVRRIAVMDQDIGLVAIICNNGTIKLAAVSEGQFFDELHDVANELAYAITSPDNNSFVSGGESGVVTRWVSNKVQVKSTVPAAVWDISTHGDLTAVAASDGCVYVFSPQEPSRVVKTAFDERMAAKKLPSVGGINPAEIQAKKEALKTKGQTDGEQRFARDGDSVGVFIWSAAQQEWQCLGHVVDQPSGPQTLNGKTYDYVFDVEIEDAKGRKLKLGYNKGENAWTVAQKWITEHKLPMHFLQEVAEFIIKNAGSGAASNNGPGTQYSSGPATKSPTAPAAAECIYFHEGDLCRVIEKLEELVAGSLTEVDQFPTDQEYTAVASVAEPDLIEKGTGTLIYQFAMKALNTWPAETLFPVLDVLRLITGKNMTHASFDFIKSELPTPILSEETVFDLLERKGDNIRVLLPLTRLLTNHHQAVSPEMLPSLLTNLVRPDNKQIVLARRAFLSLCLNKALMDPSEEARRIMPAIATSTEPFIEDPLASQLWVHLVAELKRRGYSEDLPVDRARAVAAASTDRKTKDAMRLL